MSGDAAHNRTLEIGTQRFTKVEVRDLPGPGNACHVYQIMDIPEDSRVPTQVFTTIRFQHGPIKENGVNGIHNEDLLAIVMDRLEGFQSGDFACLENGLAMEAIKDALQVLNDRTANRQERGVEGTSTV